MEEGLRVTLRIMSLSKEQYGAHQGRFALVYFEKKKTTTTNKQITSSVPWRVGGEKPGDIKEIWLSLEMKAYNPDTWDAKLEECKFKICLRQDTEKLLRSKQLSKTNVKN